MGLVYFLQNGNADLFKIGHTKQSAVARINHLSTGNPEPLTLFGSIETEHYLHCENYLHNTLVSRRHGKGVAREFFVLTPAEVQTVIAETKLYLADYGSTISNVKAFSKEENLEEIKKPGTDELVVYRELLDLLEQRNKLEFRQQILENKLKQSIGRAKGLEGIATWLSHASEKFDQKRFQTEQPDAYKVYMKVSRSRTFLLK